MRQVGYRWHLRQLMAAQGMFSTTDLLPHLAERGVELSAAQVYRLVTGTPERLNLHTLAAPVRHPGLQPGRADRAARPDGSGAQGGRWPPGRGGAAGAASQARPDRRGRPVTAATATTATAEGRSAELLAVVADAVASVEPELPAGAVAAALDGIGRLRRPRLAAWLVAYPDALVSGSSAAPKVVAEFIAALQEQGASRLVLPACAGCGRAVELFHTRGAERICRRCYNQGHTGVCADCGQQRPIAERTPTGQPRCGACHHRQRMGACVGCGRRCSGRRCSSCRRRDPATWQPCGA